MSLLSSISLNPQSYRGVSGSGGWLFGALPGGGDVRFSYSSSADAVRAFTECPPVAAIISRKAKAFINGRTWLLNKEGKEATGALADKIRNLLKRPNPLQNWKQFEAQGYIYQELFGYNVVMPIKPVGMDNSEATVLWNLPGNCLEIEEKEGFELTGAEKTIKDYIKSVTFVWGTTRAQLSLDDLYIFKDITPSFSSLIIPESRLRALAQPVSNIIGAYESRSVLINRRGALGILSNGGKDAMGMMPLDPTEKEQVQQDLMRYGLKQSQWQVIVTSASLQWQQMGFPTKDLMLFEEIEEDIMRIADAYGYPYQLLSSAKSTASNNANMNDSKKLLYQDAIIPEAESIYEQWGQFFNLEKNGLRLDKDYSHVAALQEDKGAAATARKTLNEALKIEYEQGLITMNQWLEKLGEDPLPGKLGEVRATDPKTSTVPLALTIGVGGVQSLISVITASGMSEDARRATLEILFGIKPEDAARMAAGSGQQQEGQEGSSNQGNQNQNTEEGAE